MILGIIIGVLIGIIIILCIILIPKVKHQEQLNKEILHNNEIAMQEFNTLQGDIRTARWQVEHLKEEQYKLIDAINLQEEQNEKYFQSNKENIDLKFTKYNNQLNDEYLKLAEDLAKNASKRIKQIQSQEQEKNEEYNQTIEKYNELMEEAKNNLEDLRSRVSAAVEVSKRTEEMENKKDFYRIIIPKEDIEEVRELQEVAKRLRNPLVLNKLIWSTYYQRPTNDMINRVVGSKPKIGIYKITNLENGKTYVGQTSNQLGIGERFRQHIKKGLGAEDPGRNKLYPAMKKYGVENFSFEIIEECSPEKMNELERYWIEFYHGKKWGYNIK